MKISAIICEYNPLHEGHIHHLRLTRQLCGADKVICIMSGSFTQRGEPALYDKFCRTRAALKAGADMVLELPVSFACASAERFAYGGVYTANATGLTDSLCFGCETNDINRLTEIARLLADEPPEYISRLKQLLETGISYPAARAMAVNELISGAGAIINTPNNILATEYIKAIFKLKSGITPVAVKREGGGYNDSELTRLPSALAIRTALKNGADIASLLPTDIAKAYTFPAVFAEDMFIPLMYKLRTLTPDRLKQFMGVNEGLEYKIYEAAKSAKSYSELVENIKSKRYTQTRIQRTLAAILLNIREDAAKAPSYIRVLGVKKESRELLSLLSKHASLPVITSPANIQNQQLIEDITATDIRALMERPVSPAARDYTSGLIVV